MALPVMKPHALCSAFQPSNSKINHNSLPRALGHLGQCRWSSHSLDLEKRGRGLARHLNALPDFPLMAVMVQHVEGTRDWIVHKSIWHLSDASIKNDPYDRDDYRSQGGDGTAHWWYDKQEDIEQANRAELYREELIEEIEQKVGALREIEEAIGKEEQLVK